MLAVLGQPDAVDAGTISVAGLRRLLNRMGFYGGVEDAFVSWAEISLPLEMRPIGLAVADRVATISPAAALDLLITEGRARPSPWASLLWGAAGTAVGAVLALLAQRVVPVAARRRR